MGLQGSCTWQMGTYLVEPLIENGLEILVEVDPISQASLGA